MQTVSLPKVRQKTGFKLVNSEIRIETTNHCNANCIMCPREKLTRLRGIMKMELFKSIIDEAVPYGITNVFLGGYGEPLTDPYLCERIRYIKSKSKDLFVNFISNGSLLTKRNGEELILAGLNEVRFSFYGASKEVYEKVHRCLNFEKAKENILNLISLRNRVGLDTPKIYVFFLVLDENRHETEGFKRDWIGTADAIEIWKPHNFGDGRKYRESNGLKASCNRPARGPLQVQWDGTIIPCCWDYDGKMILGDLNKQGIREVLKSPQYAAIRTSHVKNDFSNFPFCNNCDQLNPKKDALIYSNRHNIPPEEAVNLTNSNLFNLRD